MELKLDCRHFIGEKPCKFGRPCEDCPHYDPVSANVLVIKLAASGDVLRTTCILPGLRRAHPGCRVTWVVDGGSLELLRGNPMIDRALPYDASVLARCQVEEFDLVVCLDKDVRATALATLARAKKKVGFGLHPTGSIFPMNRASEYAFELGINDRLKFVENEKSYQRIVYECIEVPYEGESYVFELFDEERRYAADHLASLGLRPGAPVAGLNTGAGKVFATKKWQAERFAALARRLADAGVTPLLLGGPEEVERNRALARELGGRALDAGTHHTMRRFAAILERCDAVVTGDTLALHLAVAVGSPVVALFGATCPQEVDLFGRGEKIYHPVHCSPCYKSACPYNLECMSAIEPEEVFAAAMRVLPAAARAKAG